MGVWTVFRVSASKPNIIILETKTKASNAQKRKAGPERQQRVNIKKDPITSLNKQAAHFVYKARTLGVVTDQGRKTITHIVVAWLQER